MKKRNYTGLFLGTTVLLVAMYLTANRLMTPRGHESHPKSQSQGVDYEPSPTDAQIDTMLVRLKERKNAPVDEEELLKSLKSYKSVLEQRRQKTN